MADPPLLALAGIRYHLGDQTILDGVELGIAPGERLSLVGRNGAGKSTLLSILAGEPIADGGTRFAQPGATVATLPQEPDFTGHPTVAHYVAAGAGRFARPRRLPRRGPAGRGDARRRHKSRRAVGRRGAPRGARPRAGRPSPTCCCSTSPPTISTCRPSNGSRRSFRRWKGAYVLVSHDRRFLANLSARRAVARPRHRAPPRQGLWRVRGLVERHPRARGDRAAQARPR